nr:reverse transcriptase domain-containing protein [Tanacetum cinerariifolium]
MKGAPECMRISGFMHGVNNPELTKRLNEHVPKMMEEMMITTTAFIRGEAAAANKKKGHASWKLQDQSKRHSSDKRDECMQLKKQIEEFVQAGKLSHLIKEIKQGRDQSKTGKKETAAKDKPTAIYMVQSWKRTVKQKVIQSFERVREIAFPQLTASNETEGPLVIEAEMGGHVIHRMYIDGGSSMEILYEHCFNRLRPEIKSQMVPAPTSLTGFSDMDLFNLICAPNPTKVKIGSRPRTPYEVPLLTLTAPHVIEMDEPATTDSSGVPSITERSLLDFAHEAGASDQGAAAPEIPSSEDVPATVASGAGQAEETATMDPPAALESLKRGHDRTYVNAPSKSLRRDHADPDPDPLSFADAPLRYPADVAQSSPSIAAAGDPKSKNASSPAEVGSPRSVYQPEWGVTNGSLLDTPEACQDLYNVNLARQVAMGSQLRLRFEQEAKLLRKSVAQDATLQEQVSGEEKLKAAFEEFKRYEDDRVERRCTELDARLDALSIDFEEELYLHMLTAIAGRRWVIGHGLCLAVMKCDKSLDMRQAFADVVSAGITKGMSEGLRHGVEHGQAQLNLEGLKDAPIDVIMASLYLESDTGEDAPLYIRDLRPSSSQLTILVYPEKKKCCIVCRTHGVGYAHHARSDGISVSVPTVVPQGLALLLLDAATQTEFDDT